MHDEIEDEVRKHRDRHGHGNGSPSTNEGDTIHCCPDRRHHQRMRPIDVIETEPRRDAWSHVHALDAHEDERAEENVEKTDTDKKSPRRRFRDSGFYREASGEMANIHAVSAS